MFLIKECIDNLVKVIRTASDKFNEGLVVHREEETDLSVFKTMTTAQNGVLLYDGNKRICFIEQSSLQRNGNEGIEYTLRNWLNSRAKAQAIEVVTAVFPKGHPNVPVRLTVGDYQVTAFPMSDERFTQIKVTQGEDLIAIYTTANDIEYSHSMADVEEVLIRCIIEDIMSGKRELTII